MAKLVGLSGTGRGRVGNFVLSKGDNGATIARSYQPQVANPRTSAQLTQRTRINNAGRISSIVPKLAIAPLSMGSNRKNRSAFLRNLIRNTEVTESAGVYTANIDPRLISFGRGIQPMAASAGAIVTSANSVAIPLTLNDANLANKYGERIVVMVVDVRGGVNYQYALVQDVVLTSTTAQNVTIPLPVDLLPGQYVAVYRTPFVLTDDASAIVSSRVYASTDALMSEITSIASNIKDWGNSKSESFAPFTQA